jgi:hypothetical protein
MQQSFNLEQQNLMAQNLSSTLQAVRRSLRPGDGGGRGGGALKGAGVVGRRWMSCGKTTPK